MKVQTIKYSKDKVFGTGKLARSVKTESVNVEHNKKQSYKGSKLVRVQNVVEQTQAGSLDNKIKWAKHKDQRKRERKMRQEGV